MNKSNSIPPRLRTRSLDTLPPELIIYITDFLTSSSIACLGLTCHHLYNLAREQCSIDLDGRSERLDFLNRIARDLPEYVPCHGWLRPRLYLWRHQNNDCYHCDHCFTNPQYRCKYWRNDADSPAGLSGLPIFALCPGFLYLDNSVGRWITLGLRHLVLRHELLGKEYGIPMSTLGNFCHLRATDSTGFSRVQTFPKIVQNGNLMIHKTLFMRSKPVSNSNRTDGSLVCGHTSREIFGLVGLGKHFFQMKQIVRRTLAGKSGKSQAYLDIMKKVQEPEAFFEMCKYPDDQWHRCSVLFKCEYCATDTRFSIRQIGDFEDPNRHYEIHFDVYHDFGSLYQPITIPQRQVIEVASRQPKIQVKYPRVTEVHERILQNLEDQYHEPVPLNIRGTAIRAMEEAVKKDPEMILRSTLPTNVSFFSHYGDTEANRGRVMSPGFRQMLSTQNKSSSLPFTAKERAIEWAIEQIRRPFLPFEPDQVHREAL